MEFTVFKKEHFPNYQDWFKDSWLQAALGPMDAAWLEHVLQDQTGAQYAIFEDSTMVAVLGVVWATGEHSYHTITDLAIRPDLRRQGLGQAILQYLTGHLEVPIASGWVTYVESTNTKAIEFMKKNNWKLMEAASMYVFRFIVE